MALHPASALIGKRWDLLAEYKDQRRRERKKLGLTEALRVVGALRAQARFFQPGWPTQDDREEDLETHIRVAAALARTAPGQSPSGSRTHTHPRAVRRARRVRRAR
jgi:hypothetical protein